MSTQCKICKKCYYELNKINVCKYCYDKLPEYTYYIIGKISKKTNIKTMFASKIKVISHIEDKTTFVSELNKLKAKSTRNYILLVE